MIYKASLLPQTLASVKYVIISEVFKFVSLSLNLRLVLYILHVPGKSWSQQPCKHLSDISMELSETNTSTQSYTTNVIGTFELRQRNAQSLNKSNIQQASY